MSDPARPYSHVAEALHNGFYQKLRRVQPCACIILEGRSVARRGGAGQGMAGRGRGRRGVAGLGAVVRGKAARGPAWAG
jgi:hypothetical protein